jgi:general L-amino acid transport system substrate-binding protein
VAARDAGIDTALQLGSKAVCTQTGTTSELNLSDYSRKSQLPRRPRLLP